MGGVDKADMYLAIYRNELKTVKMYKKLFYHLLDMIINNSYIISKEDVQFNFLQSQVLYKFKLKVAKGMK
jgi:hypothetical protein